MFELKPTQIAGCFELQPKAFNDARGRFVKVFHEQAFAAHGLESHFAEEYYSVSGKNVIRGLHFQLPPVDHVKVAYCVQGAVMDVVLDLRLGSPTYGQCAVLELSAARANSIYIPKGMAHGFSTLGEQATIVYKVSTIYSPDHDAGVLWNSVDVPWGIEQPCISERDKSFPELVNFKSPFLV